jgi:hypothetical protein
MSSSTTTYIMAPAENASIHGMYGEMSPGEQHHEDAEHRLSQTRQRSQCERLRCAHALLQHGQRHCCALGHVLDTDADSQRHGHAEHGGVAAVLGSHGEQ